MKLPLNGWAKTLSIILTLIVLLVTITRAWQTVLDKVDKQTEIIMLLKEQGTDVSRTHSVQIARMEEQITSVNKSLVRIETKLDRRDNAP